MNNIFAVALLLASSSASAAPAAPLVNIGVASAVRGAVNATAPGAAGRVVETGKPVYSRDKVTTGAEGKLQVLLLDQTSFTMGANSEMELDEFVFDPATNAGKVSAKIVKGAFRFVTGKVARRDPASMQVKTPVGTIGIRGTMTAGSVNGTEGTFVLLGPGPENNADEKSGGITVKNDKGSTEIDKDGWGVTVKNGEAPGPAFELSPGQLESILAAVGSSPKGEAKDGSASGDSTDASSGQGTATGKGNAEDAFAALDAAQGDTSRFATQQFAAQKVATWEEVIGIPSGSGVYAGSAPFYDCTNGCGGPALGTMSFSMNIDFGAKTVGGGGSTIFMPSPGSNGAINTTSYAGKTGEAKMSLNTAGTYSGTSMKLLDVGGVTAGAVSLDVKYQNTPNTLGGVIGGTLQ